MEESPRVYRVTLGEAPGNYSPGEQQLLLSSVQRLWSAAPQRFLHERRPVVLQFDFVQCLVPHIPCHAVDTFDIVAIVVAFEQAIFAGIELFLRWIDG
ncbi:MAG: hypothetical protein KatS3mg038_1249 [Candidatus Kapaibacterium sp.]|nr:MAG: hypothetical protein KatS3mg038_1249 [Candidatus Kapabacteria bacterium]